MILSVTIPPNPVGCGPPADPPIDWASLELPDAWPDTLRWHRPAALRILLRKLTGKARAPVVLPTGMPGAERIPAYALHEFHNLPNGNYSHRVCHGYARGFELAMLGTMTRGRRRVADALRGASRALDVGCGAGYMAAALQAVGIRNVVGIDPSPYLLQVAARRYPQLSFIQGIAEESGLPDCSVDALSVCFVLHEIPPHCLRIMLAEFHRILVPGGRLAVLEPSVVQWSTATWKLVREFGWRGLYFKLLAAVAFEPFVAAWHRQDFTRLLVEHGFRIAEDDSGCPFRFVLARRDDA